MKSLRTTFCGIKMDQREREGERARALKAFQINEDNRATSVCLSSLDPFMSLVKILGVGKDKFLGVQKF